MAKHVFFSFHYDDVSDFRANVVRNHWVTKGSGTVAGYFDSSIWEEAKSKGDIALRQLISQGLRGTSASCILIGSETYSRLWVRYEILKSVERGNSVVGVHINRVKDKFGLTENTGPNPFEYIRLRVDYSGEAGVEVWEANSWRSFVPLPRIKVNGAIANRLQGQTFQLSEVCNTYDWVKDNGYLNFAAWL